MNNCRTQFPITHFILCFRKMIFLPFLIVFHIVITACSQNAENKLINSNQMKYNSLSPEEERIILRKGTEAPFTGDLLNNKKTGTYRCKQCNSALYRSSDKFDSGCGWPSFDDEIPDAVTKSSDSDGRRTEITCSHCGGHLGHIFTGEGFTKKNTRHCVNSISMVFVEDETTHNDKFETVYFGGGCFWGVEFYLQKEIGVVETSCGYMGGTTDNPDYESVCSHETGHAEVVKIIYDSDKIDFEKLCKLFFELHDPTQINRQGPDVGDQYRSVIFFTTPSQEKISLELVSRLSEKGLKVATKIKNEEKFWEAEGYHQDYYERKGEIPYCHRPTKRF
jgi:peptide methionine sulfoxide reductase msrA/msrB